MFSSALLGLTLVGSALAHSVPSDFRIDPHRHAIPKTWYDALVAHGYPVINGTLTIDGFPVPAGWNITDHIKQMDIQKVDYGLFGLAAPAVEFLRDDPVKAQKLARQMNLELYGYVQQYPKRIGQYCVVPLPNVQNAVAEIKFCMEELKAQGIGLVANYGGVYIGNPVFDPVMDLINTKYKNVPVQVHPGTAGCPTSNLGYSNGYSEFQFETFRVAENLILQGRRLKYPDVDIILPQAGGTVPYNSYISSAVGNLVSGLDSASLLKQFQSFFFDLSGSYSRNQLKSVVNFAGISRVVIGTDWPYSNTASIIPAFASLQANGEFTDAEARSINHTAVLNAWPGIAKKLGFTGPFV